MSRVVLGDCLSILPTLPDRCVDLALTDPPYLVNYVDRTGRSIANDRTDEWLTPAFAQMFRVLRDDAFCISFYGWNRVDRFFAAWRAAGFRAVGHIVFAKEYQSKARFLGYRHEAAYLLAKGQPAVPAQPLPDVMPWKYSGNHHHPPFATAPERSVSSPKRAGPQAGRGHSGIESHYSGDGCAAAKPCCRCRARWGL